MTRQIDSRTFTITRADLVAYAAASGDHNPIHQDEDLARSVGLPDVIAHGMFTLALVARFVREAGIPGEDVIEIGGKFAKPVVVPVDGAEVSMRLDERSSDDELFVEVLCAGERIFGPRGARVALRA